VGVGINTTGAPAVKLYTIGCATPCTTQLNVPVPGAVALTTKVVLPPIGMVCVVVGTTLNPAPEIVQVTVPDAVAVAALLNTKERLAGKVNDTAPAGVTGVIVGAPTTGQAVAIAPLTWLAGMLASLESAPVVKLNEPYW